MNRDTEPVRRPYTSRTSFPSPFELLLRCSSCYYMDATDEKSHGTSLTCSICTKVPLLSLSRAHATCESLLPLVSPFGALLPLCPFVRPAEAEREAQGIRLNILMDKIQHDNPSHPYQDMVGSGRQGGTNPQTVSRNLLHLNCTG